MKRNFFLGAFILTLLLLADSSEAQISKTFRMTNNTGMALTSVRISSANANEWGLELNTLEKMPVNSSFEFGHKIDTARCLHDIKFTAEDGTEYYMKDVNFCQLREIALVIVQDKGKTEEKPGGDEKPGMKTDDQPVKKSDDPNLKSGDTKTDPDVKIEAPPEEKKDK